MLAIQKPPPQMFAAPLFRPTHARAPSAPVVVRPTHTPGLLSLSKPLQSVPRSHVVQQSQPRQQQQQRTPPRGKPQQRSPQPTHALAQSSEDAKKPASLVPKVNSATSDKALEKAGEHSSGVLADKPLRGRQASKAAKARRSASSSSRVPARRPSHQPSPPPSTRIPSQAEVSSKRSPKLSRPAVAVAAVDPTDPFAVISPSTRDAPPSDPAKAGSKGPAFRLPSQLTQPSGKLARRRQLTSRQPSTPTPPKTAPRRKERVAALVGTVSDPLVPKLEATSVHKDDDLSWNGFPICDDSADLADDSDVTPPTTPIRDLCTTPVKGVSTLPVKGGKARRPAMPFDRSAHSAPRTAPLSSAFGSYFVPPHPTSTPTPAQRRRNHRRVPSEGVFNMSMDEDSSSSSTPDVFTFDRSPAPGSRRRMSTDLTAMNAVEGGHASSAPQPGFFAGSMFQSSPSPEELPPPSF
ncbi:hypothetical protein POSPLADRAFT_1058119 [Postia placenta MAD-698-R-SB12]|uniref:Uncharacterized protein n=1 Tax=Postia placenta MAD-698-R-SB12 TaxID=670580 RepID=A0A1X6MXW1_9APHY|nr:hypothetical protein POSPLADRAFT_1058119 [Postia placenta MAD-698-R-SB12]OSX61189.1 hypothetical protein POSPLADRAFT_1058119 [Postia placenta MAD-698-R-SB12]